MKTIILILTFLTFSTCVPVRYNRTSRVVVQPTPVVVVNPQPALYSPYYQFRPIRPVVRPPYLGNVYHKPKTVVVVRGGRRR
jgi:hypothetical protein